MFQTIVTVLTLALTAWAVVAVTLTVRRMTAVIKIGQPVVGRTDEPMRRTVTMFKETFGHTRMLQWTWVGIMHWFVYLAFIVLSTAGPPPTCSSSTPLRAADHRPLVSRRVALRALGVLGTVGSSS